MELNNTVRNRRFGFLGVAVATLLTPAGKLISSAVAAGVTMAVITMSDGPLVANMEKSPVPKLETSSALIEEYFANVIATSELTNSEPGAAILAMRENNAGLMLASTPPTVVLSSNTANGPSGGSLFDSPALGSGFVPPQIIIKNPQEVDCEQVLKKHDSERTEREKALCEAVITQTEEIKEEIVQLIAEVTPTTGGGSNPPTLVVSNDPVVSNAPAQNPEDDQKLPQDQIPPEYKPEDRPIALPSEQVFPLASNTPIAIAAIPEPSTIGLLLLGLFSLGWVYRRNTGA